MPQFAKVFRSGNSQTVLLPEGFSADFMEEGRQQSDDQSRPGIDRAFG